jgi:DNA-directed RNA polymerase subunit beta'
VADKFRWRNSNAELSKSLKITDPGDTPFNEGQIVSKSELETANANVEATGGKHAVGKKPKPSTAKTLLLGITKASLQSDSFVSAASFQETTKVLTEAALAGREDYLFGLKENVIVGHLIPAGTGFDEYTKLRVKTVAPPTPEAAREGLERLEAEELAEAKMREALGLSS